MTEKFRLVWNNENEEEKKSCSLFRVHLICCLKNTIGSILLNNMIHESKMKENLLDNNEETFVHFSDKLNSN